MSLRDTQIEERTVVEAVAMMAARTLRTWLEKQRWAGQGGRLIESITVADAVTLETGAPAIALTMLDVSHAHQTHAERVVVPIAIEIGGSPRADAVGHATVGAVDLTAFDASRHPAVAAALTHWIAQGAQIATAMGGTMRAHHEPLAFDNEESGDALDVRPLTGEQSNTSYVIDDRWILKLLRRVEPGLHPEVTMLQHLARAGFADAPRLLGYVTYRAGGHLAQDYMLAILESFVPSRGDAWRVALDEFDRAMTEGRDPAEGTASFEMLGAITAGMHLASSRAPDDSFVPARCTHADAAEVVRSIAHYLDELDGARSHLLAVRTLLARRGEILAIAREIASRELPDLAMIRVHGDFHLGQVLRTDSGFVVIDFEGEPMRPLAERHLRSFAGRDIAGMLRSFQYAGAFAARPGDELRVVAAKRWQRAAREHFLAGYLERIVRAPFALLPGDVAARARVIGLFELEKALYELLYEVRHRPDFVGIPAAGVDYVLSGLQGTGLRASGESSVRT